MTRLTQKKPAFLAGFQAAPRGYTSHSRAISKNLNGCVYFLFIGIVHTHNTFHHCVGTVEQWVPSQRIGKHAENSDGTRPNKILQPKTKNKNHTQRLRYDENFSPDGAHKQQRPKHPSGSTHTDELGLYSSAHSTGLGSPVRSFGRFCSRFISNRRNHERAYIQQQQNKRLLQLKRTRMRT